YVFRATTSIATAFNSHANENAQYIGRLIKHYDVKLLSHLQELQLRQHAAANDFACYTSRADKGRDQIRHDMTQSRTLLSSKSASTNSAPSGVNAASAATNVSDAQRKDRELCKLRCAPAAGHGAADTHSSRNKNAKTERNENLLRQLRKAITSIHPAAQNDLRLAGSDGISLIGSDPIARVHSDRPGHVHYNWRFAIASDRGIDKDAVRSRLAVFAKGSLKSSESDRRSHVVAVRSAHAFYLNLYMQLTTKHTYLKNPVFNNSTIINIEVSRITGPKKPECNVLAERRAIRPPAQASPFAWIDYAYHTFNIADYEFCRFKANAIFDTTDARNLLPIMDTLPAMFGFATYSVTLDSRIPTVGLATLLRLQVYNTSVATNVDAVDAMAN
ncbi:unnamed protein product, partial [Prorocentrum cordatum]